jgi:Cys-tRNA(Pro) deacylase
MMDDVDRSFLPQTVKQVLTVLDQAGVAYQLRIFDAPARRARDAARLLGCPIGAVVKSLVFQVSGEDQFVLALVAGENRVDLEALREVLGLRVQPAQPDAVLALTGFAVGSVPPVGIEGEIPVVMDQDLMRYDQVWASAGSAHVLVQLTPQALQTLSQAEAVRFKKSG